MDFFSALLDRAAPQPPNVLQRRRPSRFEPSPPGQPRAGEGLEAGPEVALERGDNTAPRRDGVEHALHALDSGHDVQQAPQDFRLPGRDERRPDVAGNEPASNRWTNEYSALEEELTRLGVEVAALNARPQRHDLMSAVIQEKKPMGSAVKMEATSGEHAAPHSEISDLAPLMQTIPASRNHPEAQPPALAQPGLRPLTQAPLPLSSSRREASGNAPQAVVVPTASALQPRLPPLPRPAPTTTAARRVIAAPAALPPPAVHVSIGRIEIRAVASATAAKSSRNGPAAGPKLSLDDYLKSRNGGQR